MNEFWLGCAAGSAIALAIAAGWVVAFKPRRHVAGSRPASDGERFSMIFNSAPFAIMLVRIDDGRIVDVNAGFTELWDYTRAEALGQTATQLHLWIEPARLIEQLKEQRHSDVQALSIRRKDGSSRDVIASVSMMQLDTAHLLITAADVTERNRARHLDHIAHHDTLTQLPNRRMLWSAMREIGERARGGSGVTALLFLDLDGFKRINDTLGHQAGDELLRLVAARLQRRLRAQDLLVRMGGDEFVVLLEQLDDRAQARTIAEDLIAQIVKPFALASRKEARIGMSIGIAYVDARTSDLETLVEQADLALYEAKRLGRNGVREYEPSLSEALQRELGAPGAAL